MVWWLGAWAEAEAGAGVEAGAAVVGSGEAVCWHRAAVWQARAGAPSWRMKWQVAVRWAGCRWVVWWEVLAR